jgi:hypothetical protein
MSDREQFRALAKDSLGEHGGLHPAAVSPPRRWQNPTVRMS